MLKKAFAVAAVAGFALAATPAHAQSACVDLYLEVNGAVLVDQTECTPPIG